MSVFVLPEHQSIKEKLSTIALPLLSGFSVADAVNQLSRKSGALQIGVQLGFPCERFQSALIEQIQAALVGVAPSVEVKVTWRAPEIVASSTIKAIEGVKNIVAVASGKGGVGKSTTAVNIALALAAEGARVGMLDADIYGPSQALMLGVADQRPEMYSANQMKPIIGVGGVQMMSMGNLVTESTPLVWRGPMVSGALQQLLNQTRWEDLDYLIVDMPPGTGDIQLTLSQAVPVSASIVVTTPQDIALLDAKKGIEMFRKVNIPVLGIVENMSLHTCSQCGHEEAIFGTAGGDRLAADYEVALLGRMPLVRSICEQTDRGLPPVAAEPKSDIAQKYHDLALAMAAQLWSLTKTRAAAPQITVSDD